MVILLMSNSKDDFIKQVMFYDFLAKELNANNCGYDFYHLYTEFLHDISEKDILLFEEKLGFPISSQLKSLWLRFGSCVSFVEGAYLLHPKDLFGDAAKAFQKEMEDMLEDYSSRFDVGVLSEWPQLKTTLVAEDCIPIILPIEDPNSVEFEITTRFFIINKGGYELVVETFEGVIADVYPDISHLIAASQWLMMAELVSDDLDISQQEVVTLFETKYGNSWNSIIQYIWPKAIRYV